MISYLVFSLVVLMLILTWVGLRMGRDTDLLLAGRRTTTLPLMLTFLATQLGGGTIVGAMEAASVGGWSALCYALGTVGGFFLLAAGFGPWLRRQEITTIAEIFDTKYKAPLLRKTAATLSVISLFLILVAQAVALRKMLIAIGISSDVLLLLIWGLVILYTSVGGFKAVVVTDVVQVLVILVALALVAIEVFPMRTVGTSPVSSTSIPWMQWLTMPMLYMFVEQDMGQRCCAASTPRAVRFSAMGAGILLACVAIVPVSVGILGSASGLDPIASVAAVCSPAVTLLFYLAILMAILSTADSLLNSITSNIVQDLGGQEWSRARKTGTTIAVGAGSAVIALFATSVIGVLVSAYELLVCVLVVPVLAAAILQQASKRAATLSMCIGGGIYVVDSFSSLAAFAAPVALPSAALGYAAGLVIERTRMSRLCQSN